MVGYLTTSKDGHGTAQSAYLSKNILSDHSFPDGATFLLFPAVAKSLVVASLGIFFVATLLSPQQVQPCQTKDDVSLAAKSVNLTALRPGLPNRRYTGFLFAQVGLTASYGGATVTGTPK